MTDNPYESPGVVPDDAPPSDLIRELELQTMEWFLRANDGVVVMLFALTLALSAWGVYGFLGEQGESTHWMTGGCAVAALLTAALAWFQWRYHLAAMVISGMLSLGTLFVTMGVVLSLIAHHAFAGSQSSNGMDMASELIALLAGLVFMVGWGYVASLPLRVAAQAWTWHRVGIDVGRIHEEIRRRS